MCHSLTKFDQEVMSFFFSLVSFSQKEIVRERNTKAVEREREI